MSKNVVTTKLELGILGVICIILGIGMGECSRRRAHAGTSNSSVYDNADRIARSVEHIERITISCARRTSPYSACDVP